MIYTATTQNLPAYPCDVCGQQVQPGEKVSVTDGGLTVEHKTCSTSWLRRNYGRESLA